MTLPQFTATGQALPPAAPAAPPANTNDILALGFSWPRGPAALAVVRWSLPPGETRAHYTLLHLQHWDEEGTPYSAMARDTAAVVAALNRPGATLLIDAGLGGAVVDVFRKAVTGARLVATLVTADTGAAPGHDSENWLYVPGAEMASTLLVISQEQRLDLPPLPTRDRALRALRGFGDKARELTRLSGWSWGKEPDAELVFAVSVPVWHGERRGQTYWPTRPAGEPLGGTGDAVRRDRDVGPPERNRSVFDEPSRFGSAAARHGLFGYGRYGHRGPGHGEPGSWHFG
jgi:hypothetical protein